MITTHLKKLMAVVICLLTGMVAQAQFQGTVIQYPTSDYLNLPAKFKLTEVAQALETDTAALAKAYNTWQNAETWEGENLFWLIGANDVATDEPTADGKGFWMTAEGERIFYGEGAIWFAFALVDVENDVFSINCGQMPNKMKADDSGHAKFQLRFNGKSVNFDITLNVVAKPVVDIPTPELEWGKLTIVEEITKVVTQKPRSGYDSDKVEVDLTEALSKLGIGGELLKDELSQLLFAKKAYVTEDAVMGALMSDSLTNESSAGAPGFWLRNFSDAEGFPTNECGRFDYNGDDKFYMEAFAFDAETGVLSCNLGQFPNNLKGGDTYYADLYIVLGDKAIKIRYNLILPEVQLGTLEDYEKAGEHTVRVEMEPAESYDTKNFSIDIETMVNALGCEVGEIDDFYMLDGEIEFVTGKNQEGVGYWVSMEGKVVSWGDNAMFYITPKADDYSKFGIGQYPGHMNVGDSARATLYFIAGSKYYQLNVDLVIVAPKQGDVVFESVAQRSFEVQQVPGEYAWTSGVDIPVAWVEEQIGTADWTLYALSILNEDGSEKEGNARYSKSYTCTPFPGFWMDGEGHNVGWNQGSTRVGVTVANPEGKFSLMQHPGVTLGDEFRFPLFLVNEENGKMVTFNFTYKIVETVEETLPEPELAWQNLTIVDEISIDMEQTPRGWYNADWVEVDISEALESLGISNFQMVQDKLRELLYATNSNITDSIAMIFEKSDILSNDSTAKGIGFWLRAIGDDDNNESIECVSYPFANGNHFFMQYFAFDAETGILSCEVGQFPNKLKGGKTYYAYMYMVYGTKAIRFRYNLNVPYVGSLAEYAMAGESTVTIEMTAKGDYETKDFTIDIEGISRALGCNIGDIEEFYMLDDEGGFSGWNELGRGYWLDKDGKVMKWDPFVEVWEEGRGIDAMFYVTPKADDLSILGVGQYPDHLNAGESYHANLYFLKNGMYYQLGIELNIVAGGKLGDVNHDDAIDVTDVVLIIDDILVKNPANYDASLADVNNDNYIDVTDVVMVIDAILGKIELSRGAEPIDRSAYTAFQMDLTIPAGYVLESVSLTDIAKNSHSQAYAMLPDGRCRVVVCSMNNEALPGAWDEVICLNLRGKGDAQMTIDRAVFVTIDGERHELMMNPTSIAELSTLRSAEGRLQGKNSQTSNLYDLQGRKVVNTSKGILLEDGRKVVIK